jgi:hypothetical protein
MVAAIVLWEDATVDSPRPATPMVSSDVRRDVDRGGALRRVKRTGRTISVSSD